MENDARFMIVPFDISVKQIDWNVFFIRKDFVFMDPFVVTNMSDENESIYRPLPILHWDSPKCKLHPRMVVRGVRVRGVVRQ